MSLVEAKSLYISMLEVGELEIMLPSAFGDWEQDKKRFLEIYNLNNDILNTVLLDLDDSEEVSDLDSL